jgi:hypothetical protein
MRSLLAFVILASISLVRGQIISSTSSGNIQNLGPNTALAQTFQTPGIYTVLNSFTVNLAAAGGTINFQTLVAEWNAPGSHTTGSPLWNSVTTVGTNTNFTPYSFNTGGLILDPVKTYALLVYDISGTASSPFGFSDDYAGGGLFTLSSATPSNLATNSFLSSGTADIKFSASFSVAPIPESPFAAVVIISTLVAGLVFVRRLPLTAKSR